MASTDCTPLKIDVRELAWAAGLFEGEGCITHSGQRAAKLTPRLVLASTDYDTVERFWTSVGGIGRMRFQMTTPSSRPNAKNRWEWYVNGHEKVQAVIAMLWFGMGQRRRQKAMEILRWKGAGAPAHEHRGARARAWSTKGSVRISATQTVKMLTPGAPKY